MRPQADPLCGSEDRERLSLRFDGDGKSKPLQALLVEFCQFSGARDDQGSAHEMCLPGDIPCALLGEAGNGLHQDIHHVVGPVDLVIVQDEILGRQKLHACAYLLFYLYLGLRRSLDMCKRNHAVKLLSELNGWVQLRKGR